MNELQRWDGHLSKSSSWPMVLLDVLEFELRFLCVLVGNEPRSLKNVHRLWSPSSRAITSCSLCSFEKCKCLCDSSTSAFSLLYFIFLRRRSSFARIASSYSRPHQDIPSNCTFCIELVSAFARNYRKQRVDKSWIFPITGHCPAWPSRYSCNTEFTILMTFHWKER